MGLLVFPRVPRVGIDALEVVPTLGAGVDPVLDGAIVDSKEDRFRRLASASTEMVGAATGVAVVLVDEGVAPKGLYLQNSTDIKREKGRDG
jgi:hypothetical protein